MIARFTLALFLGCALLADSQTQHKPAAAPAAKQPDDAQLYRNTTFGFRYKIPYGWVERTKEMREQQEPASSSATVPNDKGPAQGEVLLAIFERPPNAPGDTINSAVVIASESTAAYPGLKKAEDYLGPLTELTTAKGFQPEGDPDVLEIDSRQLIRADFVKPLTDKLTMRQATLILLVKGRIVLFTFIGGSEDELDELMEGLHFGTTKSGAH
ncbi:MAG: hypothetical protein WCC04_11655 [Terriglobales bacterium]